MFPAPFDCWMYTVLLLKFFLNLIIRLFLRMKTLFSLVKFLVGPSNADQFILLTEGEPKCLSESLYLQ